MKWPPPLPLKSTIMQSWVTSMSRLNDRKTPVQVDEIQSWGSTASARPHARRWICKSTYSSWSVLVFIMHTWHYLIFHWLKGGRGVLKREKLCVFFFSFFWLTKQAQPCIERRMRRWWMRGRDYQHVLATFRGKRGDGHTAGIQVTRVIRVIEGLAHRQTTQT